ncbi:MAG: PTS sugar transporter subunit IIA [Desulfobulbaceae bacterium]|nr:PTS sugar transporter subunit IIA [Desulfobulbaceae bacterium]
MLELKTDCILLDLRATSKEAVLRELAEAAQPQCVPISAEELTGVLMQREEVGSTGMGNGVALPHGKLPGLQRITICFGRSINGIHFDAVDNRPVQLFVMILSPSGTTTEYLKSLAHVSNLLKHQENRNFLLSTDDKEKIIHFFER